jgi:hypothetical protein
MFGEGRLRASMKRTIVRASLSVLFWGTGLASATLAASPSEAPPASGPRDLLALTPPMRAWVHRVAPAFDATERARQLAFDATERARQLARALLGPELGLVEVVGPTTSAAEVFASRRANCVGFALLAVALGRELGLPLSFALAGGVESYAVRGDLRIGTGHLAASWGRAGRLQILDFAGVGKPRAGALDLVADRTAAAVFHANRGAERLLAGGDRAAPEAVAALEIAVAFDPGLEQAWVNLGVARRRAGDAAGAEIAYRHALALAPRSPAALRNLASLYTAAQ